jgi:ESS family glutamate:Na+ symporter
MEQFEIPPFVSFTLTIILLCAGKLATMRYEILRRYSIPEPVVGGFLIDLINAVVINNFVKL